MPSILRWQIFKFSLTAKFLLGAGYFHSFSSRFAASVVGIDNDRESQRSSFQLYLVLQSLILFPELFLNFH
jgi:hypothetical protein